MPRTKNSKPKLPDKLRQPIVVPSPVANITDFDGVITNKQLLDEYIKKKQSDLAEEWSNLASQMRNERFLKIFRALLASLHSKGELIHFGTVSELIEIWEQLLTISTKDLPNREDRLELSLFITIALFVESVSVPLITGRKKGRKKIWNDGILFQLRHEVDKRPESKSSCLNACRYLAKRKPWCDMLKIKVADEKKKVDELYDWYLKSKKITQKQLIKRLVESHINSNYDDTDAIVAALKLSENFTDK